MKIKNIGIIIVLIALIGIGAWVLLDGKERVEWGIIPLGEEALASEGELSLAEILAKAKDVVSFKYEGIITTPGQPVITAKFWLKENKIRWEGIFERQNVVYLIDENKQMAYLYIPAQNVAMKMHFGRAEETVGESPVEQSGSIMNYNPVTVGTEILDGKSCLVIEYTTETEKVKMWIWTRYGLPIRTETTTDKGTTVIEIKNIEFVDIPDSMFELPANVQTMEMPMLGL